eukprot:scaffold221474_cov17-Tisochrysis_lutea.AAC.2
MHVFVCFTVAACVCIGEASFFQLPPFPSPKECAFCSYDTRLTESGKEGAKRAEAVAKSLEPQPDLLVISPLTRALQTASLAFLPWYSGRVIVEPLARERVWLSSDTGRSPDLLAQDFKDYPQLSFEGLPDVWWYTGGLEPEGENLPLDDAEVEDSKMHEQIGFPLCV